MCIYMHTVHINTHVYTYINIHTFTAHTRIVLYSFEPQPGAESVNPLQQGPRCPAHPASICITGGKRLLPLCCHQAPPTTLAGKEKKGRLLVLPKRAGGVCTHTHTLCLTPHRGELPSACARTHTHTVCIVGPSLANWLAGWHTLF